MSAATPADAPMPIPTPAPPDSPGDGHEISRSGSEVSLGEDEASSVAEGPEVMVPPRVGMEVGESERAVVARRRATLSTRHHVGCSLDTAVEDSSTSPVVGST